MASPMFISKCLTGYGWMKVHVLTNKPTLAKIMGWSHRLEIGLAEDREGLDNEDEPMAIHLCKRETLLLAATLIEYAETMPDDQ